ncbi:hypothetical protein OAT71_00740 [Flavobacteriales bacterium]|nr:hypothetical protein [Flavobacteriales bacterium]
MKWFFRLSLVTIAFVLFSALGNGTKFVEELMPGDRALISLTKTVDWAAIDKMGNQVVYIKNSRNLTDSSTIEWVDLKSVELKKRGEGFYYSKHLKNYSFLPETYKTLLFEFNARYYHPEFSPRGKKICFIADTDSLNMQPYVYDIKSERLKRIAIEGVYNVSWLGDLDLLVCFDADSTKLYKYNLGSKDTTLVKQFDKKINSISRQISSYLIGFKKRVEKYNKSFVYKSGYPVPYSYHKVYLLDELTMITTSSRDATVKIDFNNNYITTLAPGSKDIEPVLNETNKMMVSYSKTLEGILLRVME